MNNTENIVNLLPAIGLIVFAGTLLFFAIISWILRYHWGKHGVGLQGLRTTEIIYFSVSVILLAAMLALLAIQT